MPRIRHVAAITVILAVLLVPAGAAAEVRPPLSHQGRWLTDASGRAVILHGVNMVNKRPPYDPAAVGFGRDDARFLSRQGFNTVRLGVIFAGVEPQPGVYDDAYLRRIARSEDALADQHIVSLLDFHQDIFNERFHGEGFPDWAVQTDGLPPQPNMGFQQNYLLNAGHQRAWDHFWANDAAPDGRGLQEHYAAAWRHVAARFRGRPWVMGYDLINEPWPGSAYPACANPLGCPVQEPQLLGAMQRRVTEQIRRVDRTHTVWYEPWVLANFGARSWVPNPGDGNAGLSFHIYCLTGFMGPPIEDLSCGELEQLALDNAGDRATANGGDPILLSEFGATDHLPTIERIVSRADRAMVGWQYWAYWNEDPDGPQPTQGLIHDLGQPPRGENVKMEKLRALARPYPQAVNGTPRRWSFDPATRKFELSFRTRAVGGGLLPRRLPTEVALPRIQYPEGYRIVASGARVTSGPNARILTLERLPGKHTVSVTVAPAG